MSEETELPPNVQEQLAKLQQLQQTLQIITAQKQQVEMELTDIDKALEELKKLGAESLVYRSVGTILVKRDKDYVMKDLAEKKELLNVRASVLGKQEERTRDRYRELQQQIQSKLRQTQPS